GARGCRPGRAAARPGTGRRRRTPARGRTGTARRPGPAGSPPASPPRGHFRDHASLSPRPAAIFRPRGPPGLTAAGAHLFSPQRAGGGAPRRTRGRKRAAAGRTPRGKGETVPGERILVVDDEEANRRMVRCVLEPLGYEVREAADGEDALESLTRQVP